MNEFKIKIISDGCEEYTEYFIFKTEANVDKSKISEYISQLIAKSDFEYLSADYVLQHLSNEFKGSYELISIDEDLEIHI